MIKKTNHVRDIDGSGLESPACIDVDLYRNLVSFLNDFATEDIKKNPGDYKDMSPDKIVDATGELCSVLYNFCKDVLKCDQERLKISIQRVLSAVKARFGEKNVYKAKTHEASTDIKKGKISYSDGRGHWISFDIRKTHSPFEFKPGVDL
jgi:hypothetical protein